MGSPPLVRERQGIEANTQAIEGSPPLVRERLAVVYTEVCPRRDHPRSCGKDGLSSPVNSEYQGSPPLVRERLISLDKLFSCCRITPARAGKTHFFDRFLDCCQDHPRSCGKDKRHEFISGHRGGSPPLVRERLCPIDTRLAKHGITPARAGKTPNCIC